uniref:Uncharacterized protein n=1 Tax=Oryza meridionalis TaxID=40149 RepID=A0A0E0D369_9ORYZ
MVDMVVGENGGGCAGNVENQDVIPGSSLAGHHWKPGTFCASQLSYVGRLFSGKKEDKTTEAAPAQA